ncbi:MAG TPA: hypothetical protein VFE14_19935 [Micromonosporaceae bacterium]|nr:hypothetical protein [Micromonosporaceae bacterium]
MTRRGVLSAGLWLLGLLHLGWGIWALVTPYGFFTTFPGLGQRWTAGYPPYNAHLVSDLGATFTTLGVLLVTAAVLRDRRVSIVVLTGVIAFSGLHLLFHAVHHGLLTGGSLGASIAALALGVLVPAVLLWGVHK